ncbi:MAG: T9SS type A sorting domain-containing protein [Bacteroidales bacterium]|nr:T9SS type A sorting domain-containing protein [Bacteroidales bacterium]
MEFLSDASIRTQGWTANYTSTSTIDIDEVLLKNNLKIFPNPTYGVFTIFLDIETFVTFEILDILGKQVLKTNKIIKEDNNIEASELSNGIYMIKFSIRNSSFIERLIIN